MSGTVAANGDAHHILNDFAIKLTAKVKAGSHSGFLCKVKREDDEKIRYDSSIHF